MKKKRILIIIGAVIILIGLLFGVDYLLATKGSPFLASKSTDKGVTTYNGLFYTVKKCNNLTAFNSNLICEEGKDYIIIDETKSCDKKEELFYEDNDYEYYYPCTKDKTTLYKKGEKVVTLSEALKNKDITIDELKTSGLSFTRKDKIEFNFTKSSTCSTVYHTITNAKEETITLYTYCLDKMDLKKGVTTINFLNYIAQQEISVDEIMKSFGFTKKDNYYEIGEYVVAITEKATYVGTKEVLNNIK